MCIYIYTQPSCSHHIKRLWTTVCLPSDTSKHPAASEGPRLEYRSLNISQYCSSGLLHVTIVSNPDKEICPSHVGNRHSTCCGRDGRGWKGGSVSRSVSGSSSSSGHRRRCCCRCSFSSAALAAATAAGRHEHFLF